MSDVVLVRLIIAGACLLLIVLIWLLRPGRPKQGRRVSKRESVADTGRAEPTLGEALERDLKNDRGGIDTERQRAPVSDAEPAVDDAASGSPPTGNVRAPQPSHPTLGIRQDEAFDRIVTLFVAARAGQVLTGPDLVVAAEKAGLVHGHMSIYHRLVDGKPEAGPIFSVANMVKPGTFD
ncbi:MAG: hypothetical protein JSS03_08135, partial [Proteobacteria bacterium]|nr:hypothetical protein [Pseudomonadota bacterium]